MSIRKQTVGLVLLTVLLGITKGNSQQSKKELTPADYKLWGTMLPQQISDGGKWVSYSIGYESGADTLFVRNATATKTYNFPTGDDGRFAGQWFVCKLPTGAVVLNLATGTCEHISDVLSFAFSASGNELILLVKSGNSDKLVIRTAAGKQLDEIIGVKSFVMNPQRNALLCATEQDKTYSLTAITLGKEIIKTGLASGSSAYQNLVWQSNGEAVAFFNSDGGENRIGFYVFADKRLISMDRAAFSNFPDGYKIQPSTVYNLSISEDCKRVFVGVEPIIPRQKIPDGSQIEVWNANDKWIYPLEQRMGRPKEAPKLAVWWPDEMKFFQISNDSLPHVFLNGNQQYAIVSDPKAYEPQYEREGPHDYYITELATGKMHPFLKKHSDNSRHTIPSPNGKFIAYFHEKNWWIYDMAKWSHKNVTEYLGVPFHEYSDRPGEDTACGILGWTNDGSKLLVYDRYDVWSISPDGTDAKRLTNGAESMVQYRFAGKENPGRRNFDGWNSDSIDMGKGLMLRMEGPEGESGYFHLPAGNNGKPVVYRSGEFTELHFSDDRKAIMYCEQRYDLPPRLMLQKISGKSKVVMQSNPQHYKYQWSFVRVIRYRNSRGEELKGVLFSPTSYDPAKKYPMIVNIYERQSKYLHHYENPSTLSVSGINIPDLTANGYFVLMPDIAYEIGNPGISAVDCAEAAVNAVLAEGIIDSSAVGLMGHSFGGYETNFIITQTNMFAAAISSAGISDMRRHSLEVGWNFGVPNAYRAETFQFRMGKSLFEDFEGYERNSPVTHAAKITTPLFSWSGREDFHVHWYHTVSFYLTLRRLEKEHIMVLYPKEAHFLSSEANMLDLRKRVHDWFGHYLKKEPAAQWIRDGTSKR